MKHSHFFPFYLAPKHSIPSAALCWDPHLLLPPISHMFLITEQARSFYKNLFIFLLKALSSFSFGSHLSFVQMKPVHSGKYRLSLLQK